MDEVFANTPGVETWVTIIGFSMMEGAALPKRGDGLRDL